MCEVGDQGVNVLQKDWWDKSQIIIYGLGVIALIISSIFISYSIKEKERQTNMVGFATNILANEPSKNSQKIRIWAIEIINKYSTEEIPKEGKEFLLDNKLPILTNTKREAILSPSGKVIVTPSGGFKSTNGSRRSADN